MSLPFFYVPFLGMLFWIGAVRGEPKEKPSPANVASLPVMTWCHPVLEPGIAGITLLCTVVSVTDHPKVYGNPYHSVRLKIDERFHVAENYKKRLDGVQYIDTGDFRQRTVGERLVLFAGGEPYQGDDFLLPCWSGTTTDLGILLYPSEHEDSDANDELLQQLRAVAKNEYVESEFMKAFAEFCPKGVAETFVWRLRMKEAQEEKRADHATEK